MKKLSASYRLFPLFFFAFLICLSDSFSQQSELHWVKTFGGTYADLAYDVKVNSQGDIYLLCSSGSSLLKLDSIELNTPPSCFADKMYLAAKGQVDKKEYWRVQKNLGKGVLIKLDPRGKVLWSLKLFSNNDSTGTDPYQMLIDREGNLLVTGLFTKYFSEKHYSDQAFLSKINSDGNILWTQKLDLGQCKGVDIGLDENNNIFLLGNYRYANKLKFSDKLQLPSKSKMPWSTFIACFNSEGQAVWAQKISGNNYDLARKLKVGSKGDVYFLLEYNSPSLELGSQKITNQGGYDLALGRLDGGNGEVIWMENIGGTHDEMANDIVEHKGQVVVIGYSAGQTLKVANKSYTNSPGNSFLFHLKSTNGTVKHFAPQRRKEGSLYITAAEVSKDELFLLGIISENTNTHKKSHLELYNYRKGELEIKKEINIEDYDVGTAFTFTGKDTILLSGYFEYPLLSSEDSSKKAYFDTDLFLLSFHFPRSNHNVNESILPFKADSLFDRNHRDDMLDRSVLIYPNPSSDGSFTLRMADKIPEGNIQIKVHDLGGKLVLSKAIKSSAYIKISDLSSGSYVIQLELSNGKVIQEQVIVL